MKKENWVEMWDFPTYEISSLGNVRRTESKRPLKIRGDGNGYNVVCIFYQGRKYTKRVAKSVWQSFNQQFCTKTVEHIDQNKLNDNVDNLSCISMRDNYDARKKIVKNNKYNLTNELKGQIYDNITNGTWTCWDVWRNYQIPLNYTKNTMKRNSWAKYSTNEEL